jgi:hypothetical protein
MSPQSASFYMRDPDRLILDAVETGTKNMRGSTDAWTVAYREEIVVSMCALTSPRKTIVKLRATAPKTYYPNSGNQIFRSASITTGAIARDSGTAWPSIVLPPLLDAPYPVPPAHAAATY